MPDQITFQQPSNEFGELFPYFDYLMKNKYQLAANSVILGLITTSLLCFDLNANANEASKPSPTIEIEKIRNRVGVGQLQTIYVKPKCLAWSSYPNSSENYWTDWNGPCKNGYADGYGEKRVKAGGKIHSIAKGKYSDGIWVETTESYTISIGRIVKFPAPQVPPKKQAPSDINLKSLPSWAEEIALELPRAKKEWDEYVKIQSENIKLLERSQNQENEILDEVEISEEVKSIDLINTSEIAPNIDGVFHN